MLKYLFLTKIPKTSAASVVGVRHLSCARYMHVMHTLLCAGDVFDGGAVLKKKNAK